MIIETSGLRKSFRSRQGSEKKTVEAVRGVDLQRRRGRDLRLPRPQRRRQDHHAAHARHADRARRRRRPPSPASTCCATRARCAGGSATSRRAAAPGTTRPRARSWCSRPGCTASARREAQARAARALDAFQLTEYADRKCKTYSGGQRRRVDIALGIIHEPQGRLPRRADHRPRPAEPRPHVGRGPPAARRGHDRLPHHALPRRGRRALRPASPSWTTARSSPRARRPTLKREISGDVVTVGLHRRHRRGRRGARRGRLRRTSSRSRHDDGLRLYVDDGATAIPQILRALDARRHRRSTSIELHRPSLDDVFLTKTGRSLREKLSDEAAPRHLADLPAPDPAAAAQPGLGLRRHLPAGDVPAAVRAAAQAGAGAAGVTSDAEAYRDLRARPAGAARHLRRPVPGLRPDRRAAGRRHRALPGHPGQPGRAAARPLPARRGVADRPGRSSSRCWRCSSTCGSSSATCCWRT